MADTLYSRFWPQICHLSPQLHAHIRPIRQVFRGQEWIVLQDQATGNHHRMTPELFRIIAMMDGKRNLDEIWSISLTVMGSSLPTQSDIVQTVTQLYRADLLVASDLPDLDELTQRSVKLQKQRKKKYLSNPLAIRIPLWDPNEFLTKFYPLVSWLSSPIGIFLYSFLILSGIIQLALSWPQLVASVSDQLISAESILPMLLTYPFIKLLHELGHGFAVKHWNGRVRELGVMILVFFPIPYVDASDSTGFANKHQRAVVGAAGILVELALASIAMLIWARLEPGLFRAVTFNVLLLSGVSTMMFNGNPLLRFDGYYVLTDMIEMPNLGARGQRYWQYLIQKFLGVSGFSNPCEIKSERKWLLFYPPLSFLYRVTVVIGIALLLVEEYFIVGGALALWSLYAMFLRPIVKSIWFLYSDSRLDDCRLRAVLISAAFISVLGLGLFYVPVPQATMAQGVIWQTEDTIIRAETDGIITEIFVNGSEYIDSKTKILHIENPILSARVDQLKASLQEARLRYRALSIEDRAAANIVNEEIQQLASQLNDAKNQVSAMVVKNKTAGRIVIPNPKDSVGRFIHRGEVVAYILPTGARQIRTVIPQDRIDLLRRYKSDITVRLSNELDKVYVGKIIRSTPAATHSIPSAVLTTKGGGEFLVDPTAPLGQLTSLEPIFVMDIQLEEKPRQISYSGLRAYVRFDHGTEPLGYRVLRALRIMFIKELNV